MLPDYDASLSTAFIKVDPAWLRYGLTLQEFKVLLALAKHANWSRDNGAIGRCYPSRETIANHTGMHPTHVSEALRGLQGAGLVTTVRLGLKNVYYVRQVGQIEPMPPSGPVPFFQFLADHGVRFMLKENGRLDYRGGSELLPVGHLLYAILGDYMQLKRSKHREILLQIK